MKDFKFELVSPVKLVFSDQISMIVLPGEEGYFGVLKNHMPMVSQLRTGLLEIYKNDRTESEKIFFIEGGVAEIDHDSCTVLAETIYDKDNMNLEDLLKKESEIELTLDSLSNNLDKKNALAKLESIQEFIRLLNVS